MHAEIVSLRLPSVKLGFVGPVFQTLRRRRKSERAETSDCSEGRGKEMPSSQGHPQVCSDGVPNSVQGLTMEEVEPLLVRVRSRNQGSHSKNCA